MNKIKIFLILMLTVALCSCAQRSNSFDRTATSSITVKPDNDGGSTVTTINRRFTLVDVPTRRLPGELLLQEEFRREHQMGSEGGESVVKVDAWSGTDLSTKVWTIDQKGDQGQVFEEFYRVTKYGCCAAIATNVFFNLETGRRVFSSTQDLVSVTVPNTGLYRYVAFHSNEAIIPALDPRKEDFVGLLQYGPPEAPLWKLAIYSKQSAGVKLKLLHENEVVESDSLILWKADGKNDKSSLSNFSIVVSLSAKDDVILPITNDAVDFSKVTLPARTRVEIVE